MAQGKKGKSGAKAKEPTEVVAHLHDDKRRNIPTSELAHMVEDDERKPKPLLYPRDPSLDPQLVWNGKDELDLDPLEVPAVPIYIQEKIDPRAIVENLRKTAQAGEPEPEMTLFADFDGLDPLESVEFYEHDGNWSNRMILGDSMLVMASLAEKENLRGKVQMIYVDPPYGIKFGSNWQVSTRTRDVKDGKSEDASREPEVVKAFRDTWKNGVHSYLTYLRDRLVLARDLLTETGSVFVQIGDENVHRTRALLDEVFGDANFVSQIVIQTSSGMGGALLDGVCDYILWYARDRERVKYRQLYREKVPGDPGGKDYTWVDMPGHPPRKATSEELEDPSILPEGARLFAISPLTSQRPAQGADLRSYEFQGKEFTPGNGTFKTDKAGLDRLAWAGRLYARENSLRYIRYLDDFPVVALPNVWTDVSAGFRASEKVFVVQTQTPIITRWGPPRDPVTGWVKRRRLFLGS